MSADLKYSTSPEMRKSIYEAMVKESRQHPDTQMKFEEIIDELELTEHRRDKAVVDFAEMFGILAVMQAIQTEMLEDMYGKETTNG